MKIEIPSDLEAAIREEARRVGQDPAERAIEKLRQHLKDYPKFFAEPVTTPAPPRKDLEESSSTRDTVAVL